MWEQLRTTNLNNTVLFKRILFPMLQTDSGMHLIEEKEIKESTHKYQASFLITDPHKSVERS